MEEKVSVQLKWMGLNLEWRQSTAHKDDEETEVLYTAWYEYICQLMSSLVTFEYSVGKKTHTENPYSDELSVCNKKISLNGHMNIN